MQCNPFESFAFKCNANGLFAKDCRNGHWQIEGGRLKVNYYPFSKKKTIWAHGTTSEAKFSGTEEDAIMAALGQAPTLKLGVVKTERKGQNWSKRMRRKLLKRSRLCFYCKKLLTPQTITVDHSIPLSRGGSNEFDNLVGACEHCNRLKGNKIILK